jgi:hypothetical protein
MRTRAGLALALVTFASEGAFLRANDAIPAAAAGVSEGPKAPRLIVLRSGKVLEGTIRVVNGGYEIDSNGGRVFLADSFIWLTAESREDAYRIIRERIPEATADGHVRIAHWCIENHLHSAARGELRSALRLEPQHRDARAMLRMLEPASPKPSDASGAGGALPGDVQTLGDLSPTAAREFVTRIQPLLVNRCGNAACHGKASGQSFTLRSVRAGSAGYKGLTGQNLDAVRAQIHGGAAESSPLLVAAGQTGHGGTRKPLFPGPTGEAQLRSLAAWVRTVARTAPLANAADDHDSLRLAAGAEQAPGKTGGDVLPVAAGEAADPTADLLRQAVAEERPDAFDPQEFNRRFGPRSGDSPSLSIDGPTR